LIARRTAFRKVGERKSGWSMCSFRRIPVKVDCGYRTSLEPGDDARTWASVGDSPEAASRRPAR
jgi:hypothetical protein